MLFTKKSNIVWIQLLLLSQDYNAAACLTEGEKVSQAQIAVAGDASIRTSRKKIPRCREHLTMTIPCSNLPQPMTGLRIGLRNT
jgi:hypothetical protein